LDFLSLSDILENIFDADSSACADKAFVTILIYIYKKSEALRFAISI